VDDQILFQGLKKGDRKSVEYIYTNYFDSVKYWVRNNKGSEEDAADIFQETLETILLKIEAVHTSLGGLIMQLSKRKWIDRLRKEKQTKEVRLSGNERQGYDEGSEAALIEKEKAYLKFKVLEQTFQELSELCQKLLNMLKEGKQVEELVTELAFSNANSLYRRKAACVERWGTLIKQNANYDNII